MTPGLRFADDEKGDRKGDYSCQGKALGSDYIVVGKKHHGGGGPKSAYERCVTEFVDDMEERRK